jgi:SAM-dependent methyltransferase
MSIIGFEYRKKKDETPFETFLRYTDQKEKSATKLATILQKELQEDSSILDVGTGNGEYLNLALTRIRAPKGLTLHLIEPSGDLAERLGGRFGQTFPKERLKIVKSELQSFVTDEQFDVILMSHLFYHLPRAIWGEQLTKVLSLLKPTGALIVVGREKDDAYDFKMAFKPQLAGKSSNPITIDDVLDALPKNLQLQITRHVATAELKIPFQENQDDTISIIEFYLHKPWSDIPEAIRQVALAFIKDKKGTFKQLDGIAVIKKS